MKQTFAILLLICGAILAQETVETEDTEEIDLPVGYGILPEVEERVNVVQGHKSQTYIVNLTEFIEVEKFNSDTMTFNVERVKVKLLILGVLHRGPLLECRHKREILGHSATIDYQVLLSNWQVLEKRSELEVTHPLTNLIQDVLIVFDEDKSGRKKRSPGPPVSEFVNPYTDFGRVKRGFSMPRLPRLPVRPMRPSSMPKPKPVRAPKPKGKGPKGKGPKGKDSKAQTKKKPQKKDNDIDVPQNSTDKWELGKDLAQKGAVGVGGVALSYGAEKLLFGRHDDEDPEIEEEMLPQEINAYTIMDDEEDEIEYISRRQHHYDESYPKDVSWVLKFDASFEPFKDDPFFRQLAFALGEANRNEGNCTAKMQVVDNLIGHDLDYEKGQHLNDVRNVEVLKAPINKAYRGMHESLQGNPPTAIFPPEIVKDGLKKQDHSGNKYLQLPFKDFYKAVQYETSLLQEQALDPPRNVLSMEIKFKQKIPVVKERVVRYKIKSSPFYMSSGESYKLKLEDDTIAFEETSEQEIVSLNNIPIKGNPGFLYITHDPSKVVKRSAEDVCKSNAIKQRKIWDSCQDLFVAVPPPKDPKATLFGDMWLVVNNNEEHFIDYLCDKDLPHHVDHEIFPPKTSRVLEAAPPGCSIKIGPVVLPGGQQHSQDVVDVTRSVKDKVFTANPGNETSWFAKEYQTGRTIKDQKKKIQVEAKKRKEKKAKAEEKRRKEEKAETESYWARFYALVTTLPIGTILTFLGSLLTVFLKRKRAAKSDNKPSFRYVVFCHFVHFPYLTCLLCIFPGSCSWNGAAGWQTN